MRIKVYSWNPEHDPNEKIVWEIGTENIGDMNPNEFIEAVNTDITYSTSGDPQFELRNVLLCGATEENFPLIFKYRDLLKECRRFGVYTEFIYKIVDGIAAYPFTK
jgi:hypothetical protein